jgi:hypothetical protein
MGKPKDITGQRFGRLIAVKRTGKSNNGTSFWLCKCDCGNEKIVNIDILNRGKSKSCGCLRSEVSRKNASKIASLNDFENIKKAQAYVAEFDSKEGTRISSLTAKISKLNTSGVKGVSWDKRRKRWLAQMDFKGAPVLRSNFINKKDAINARKEAEEKYFKPILKKYEKGNDGNETVQISKQGKS